ncbi:MAG: fibronectin type III domain-containing protein [Gaiellaceae bacterium]
MKVYLHNRWPIVAALAAAGVVAAVPSAAAAQTGAGTATSAAPANDNFADAIVLSGNDASRLGDTNVGATLEAGEPATVGGAPAGASIWYRWTAPDSGEIKVDTVTSDFDTLLGVYTGSAVSGLTEVASNDDGGGSGTSAVTFAVTTGTTYQIRVDGYFADTGTINLHLHRVLPPANDDFANAIVLSGPTAARTDDTNEGATLAPGEATTVAGVSAGASVWYQWTAADGGQLKIDTATSSFDTLLGIYTGSAVATLSEVASNNDAKDRITSSVTFAVTAGTTYRIRVDGGGGSTGTINLHLRETLPGPPPVNDDFANAVVLSGQNASRSGDTNVHATVEAGEPTTVAGAPTGASVWYRWTPAATGVATIDTATSDFDTLLAVYTGGAVGTLDPLASNDDAGVQTSSVTFQATGGTVYQIRVDGYAGDAGTVNLHLDEVLAPANDIFANAIALSGRSASRTGDTNVGATLEPGEPDTVAGEPAGASVWYRWTAPAAGQVRIDTTSSSFDTLLGVYTGSAANSLTVVASNDQSGGADTSAVTFLVAVGTTYQIRVDGYFADTGLINLHLATTPDPPTGVSATAGAGQATLNWASSAVDSGSPVTGYQVTIYVGGVFQQATNFPVQTQVTINGLANGTAYTFRVSARNAVGIGVPSVESNAVTPRTVPGGPPNISATAGTGQATVNWSTPLLDGGSPVTGYLVWRMVGSVVQGVTNVGVVTQATIPGLVAGTTYTFRVSAVNAAGAGPQSDESNPVVPAALRFAVTITKSGAGSGTVTSNVGGINCGAVCSADVDAGTPVTLIAAAGSGSTFAGWAGACTGTGPCTVQMDAAKNAVATFNKPVRKVSCVVPNLKRKTLAKAKRSIAAAHCRTGKVSKATSQTVPKGRVIGQSPKAGKKLASGSKVNVVVSRGKA